MSRSKKFNVNNKVDAYINIEIGKRMLQTGENVRKGEIYQDIANYVCVGVDNIKMINRGVVTPSLPVALKIAEYFNVKVEDIFKIAE